MSNASSRLDKNEPAVPAPSGLMKFLLYSRFSGIFALGEFVLLEILSTTHRYLSAVDSSLGVTLGLVALRGLQVFILVLFLTHSAATIRRRTWDPWFSLLAAVLIYFLCQAAAAELVHFYSQIQVWPGSRPTAWIDSAAAQSTYIFLISILSLSAVYGYLQLFRIKLSAIGLRRPRWSDLGWGMVAYPVYFIVYLLGLTLVIQLVPGFDAAQKQHLGFDNVQGALPLILTFVCLVILPPLVEEIMMRGLLYSSLRKATPFIIAALMTSILFAVAHLPAGGPAGPLYVAALDTFILSLVLVYLREKTGGLWASMTLHAVKNGIAYFILYIAPLLQVAWLT